MTDKGIDFHNNKWRARCYINGKEIHLGQFTTVEEARDAIANRPPEFVKKQSYKPFYDKSKKAWVVQVKARRIKKRFKKQEDAIAFAETLLDKQESSIDLLGFI